MLLIFFSASTFIFKHLFIQGGVGLGQDCHNIDFCPCRFSLLFNLGQWLADISQ